MSDPPAASPPSPARDGPCAPDITTAAMNAQPSGLIC